LDSILRIGASHDQVALWQASAVAKLLLAAGLNTRVVLLDPLADKQASKHTTKNKRVSFTDELDEQLERDLVDIAVMSASDLPLSLACDPDQLAFTKREPPNDVILSLNKYFTMEDESQRLVLGAGSPLRIALIRRNFAKVKALELPGNFQAQLRKMEDGSCDALVLDHALAHQMGCAQLIVKHLPIAQFTPRAGQGSIAIKLSAHLPVELTAQIKQASTDLLTELCIGLERNFAHHLSTAVASPCFAYAELLPEDTICLHGGYISANGRVLVGFTRTSQLSSADDLGEALAEEVLSCTPPLKESKGLAR